MTKILKLGELLPAKARQAVYIVLATLYGLELVWDWVSGPLESKLLATAAVLGFGMAATNTKP